MDPMSTKCGPTIFNHIIGGSSFLMVATASPRFHREATGGVGIAMVVVTQRAQSDKPKHWIRPFCHLGQYNNTVSSLLTPSETCTSKLGSSGN